MLSARRLWTGEVARARCRLEWLGGAVDAQGEHCALEGRE